MPPSCVGRRWTVLHGQATSWQLHVQPRSCAVAPCPSLWEREAEAQGLQRGPLFRRRLAAAHRACPGLGLGRSRCRWQSAMAELAPPALESDSHAYERWMSVEGTEPTYTLTASVADSDPLSVLQYLARPATSQHLHPLIQSFDVLDESVDQQGNRACHINFVDRIKMLGVPTTLSYHAHSILLPRAEPPVLIFSTKAKGTIVIHRYEATPSEDGTGTRVVDLVWVKAPLGLGWYVRSTAKGAHKAMMARLPEEFSKQRTNA